MVAFSWAGWRAPLSVRLADVDGDHITVPVWTFLRAIGAARRMRRRRR